MQTTALHLLLEKKKKINCPTWNQDTEETRNMAISASDHVWRLAATVQTRATALVCVVWRIWLIMPVLLTAGMSSLGSLIFKRVCVFVSQNTGTFQQHSRQFTSYRKLLMQKLLILTRWTKPSPRAWLIICSPLWWMPWAQFHQSFLGCVPVLQVHLTLEP